MALFTGDGWLFLLRWFHFLAGITWIGLLYYFNFVQTPFFATADAPVRTGMIAGSLGGRGRWWFPCGARPTRLPAMMRAEEHTSELQARSDLVSRPPRGKKDETVSAAPTDAIWRRSA